mgnify:CR=1 FL=1
MNFLHDARTRLGFDVREIAAQLDISPAAWKELERSDYDNIDTELLMALRDLLGLDMDSLLDGRFPERHPVATLLKCSTNTLPVATRLAISAATSAGRDYTTLRTIIDPEQPGTAWTWLKTTRPDRDYSHPREGKPEKLAARARRKLGLSEDAPIPSMRDLLWSKGVLLLEDDFSDELDACSMGTALVAPLILTNTSGTHMQTGTGRRVAWAHELLHLLYDRPMMLGVKRYCVIAPGPGRVRGDWAFMERRARSFSVHFLAPRRSVQALWSSSSDPVKKRFRQVMETFGIGYEATRNHLYNLGLLPHKEAPSSISASMPQWDTPERLPTPDAPGASGLPALRHLHKLGTPAIRGGFFAQRVLETFLAHRRQITPGQVADLLRVPNGAFQRDYLADMREHTPTG